MTNASQAIITKGLTGGRTGASSGGSIITAGSATMFREPDDVKTVPSSGGAALAPGAVANLYQPVTVPTYTRIEPGQTILIDKHHENEFLRTGVSITSVVSFNGVETKREFTMPSKIKSITVDMLSLTNQQRPDISVNINGVVKRPNIDININSFTTKQVPQR